MERSLSLQDPLGHHADGGVVTVCVVLRGDEECAPDQGYTDEEQQEETMGPR
jgi:hypothetical protein